MTQAEKVKELYETLKPKCEKEGLNLAVEVRKALDRFLKENPELEEQWGKESVSP
ncbi:MAG: hypothetical protein IK038_02275 [Bacteroidaceae bacterium]|nr:hypothetical protein [Bacteroidaceae bacterium]